MDIATEAIAQRIRAASATGTQLRIRGGGTKDFYGNLPTGELLETSAISGIKTYEPSELYVTARAGTPLADVEAQLALHGQCFPFEPPHFGAGSTIGGMVAAGLSGPARANAGAVREFVLGVTMINGRGELLTFGGQVMKNVAGYDVSRLMTGAMGTLGLIVEVSLKVLPNAPAEATLNFAMDQHEAIRRVNEWSGKPLPLNASCWNENTLMLRLRGAVAAVDSACRAMGGERIDNAVAHQFWTACRDQKHAWFEARGDRDLWRLSVPQTAPVIELPDTPLVEWHGGQRWVRATAGEGASLRAKAEAAGGHATLFAASAAPNNVSRFAPLASPLDRIHRELKREFDPAGIFNRGRLSADF